MDGRAWDTQHVPAHYSSPQVADGYNLLIQGAQRSDDGQFTCSVSSVQADESQESRESLQQTVQLTILGELSLSLEQWCSCMSIHIFCFLRKDDVHVQFESLHAVVSHKEVNFWVGAIEG